MLHLYAQGRSIIRQAEYLVNIPDPLPYKIRASSHVDFLNVLSISHSLMAKRQCNNYIIISRFIVYLAGRNISIRNHSEPKFGGRNETDFLDRPPQFGIPKLFPHITNSTGPFMSFSQIQLFCPENSARSNLHATLCLTQLWTQHVKRKLCEQSVS